MRARLAILVMLTAGLTACDSADPTSTTPPGTETPTVPGTTPDSRRSFIVVGAPATLDVEVNTTSRLDLRAIFGQGNPPNLVVRSAVTTGEGVTILRRGYDLDITAGLNESGNLLLTARADGYRDTTLAIPVRGIAGICPPEPSAGSRDYFPLTPGSTARYQYTHDYASSHTGEYSTSVGVLQLTIGSGQTCARGIRSIPIKYSFEGTLTRRNTVSTGPAIPYSAVLEVTLTEDSAHSFDLPILLVKNGGNASASLTVTRYGTPDAPVDYVTSRPFYNSAETFRFADGRGLTSAEQGGAYYGFGFYDSWSLTLMDGI